MLIRPDTKQRLRHMRIVIVSVIETVRCHSDDPLQVQYALDKLTAVITQLDDLLGDADLLPHYPREIQLT
jgi:hypothetical protein